MLRALVLALLLGGGAAQAASLPITITFQQAPPITIGETAILSTADNFNANFLLAQGPYALSQPRPCKACRSTSPRQRGICASAFTMQPALAAAPGLS